MHSITCDDFSPEDSNISFFNPNIAVKLVDDKATYISNDFETHTLIG